MIISSKEINNEKNKGFSSSYQYTANPDYINQLKKEENLFARYFLWSSMIEENQFQNEEEKFYCLLFLVFQGKTENVNFLFSKGVLEDEDLDLIKIGYPREVIIKKIEESKNGSISIPERKSFDLIENSKSSIKAVNSLKFVFDEVNSLPKSDIFDRLGAWVHAYRSGNFFHTDIEEVEWFIEYVLQRDQKNLQEIYQIKPAIKYSKAFMERKLEQFLNNGGKVTISPNDKLDNLQELNKELKNLQSLEGVPLTLKKNKESEFNQMQEEMSKIWGINLDDERLKELVGNLPGKLKNNDEILNIQELKKNSAFHICIEEDFHQEMSFLYRVVFLPLQKEGFFKSNEEAEEFFIYKMVEIFKCPVEEVLEKASQLGIQLKEPNSPKKNYSEYFINDSKSWQSYELYKRFREKDFIAKRYKIVDSSTTKLYFLEVNYAFKEQKDLHFELRSNAEVSRLNTVPVISRKKDSDQDYEHLSMVPYKIGCFSCFMVEDESEEIQGIGLVEVTELDEMIDEYNFAYLLKIEHQGKLLGYCMAKAMIDYIKMLTLKNPNNHPIKLIAVVHRDHAASLALLKKLGFQQVFGPNKEEEFYIRGMVCFKYYLNI